MDIRIETDSRFCEVNSRRYIASFPHSQLQVSLNYRPPAPIQMAGAFETLFIYLDPATFKQLVVAAAAIIGAEVVKDAYQWIKGLFQENCTKRATDTQKREFGIELRLLGGSPGHGQDNSISIQYLNVIADRQTGLRVAPWDLEAFNEDFRRFEEIIAPTIAFWSGQSSFQSVHVDGYMGPGEKRRRWALTLTFADRPPLTASIR